MQENLQKMMIRKKKLENNIRKLETRLSNYKKEHDELHTTLEVMKRFGVDIGDTPVVKSYIPPTIGDMAVDVLKENASGLSANEILREIQARWKPDLMRTSLSPPLSRFKDKGEIDYNEETGRWFIPNKNKSPDAQASEASNSFEQGEDEYSVFE